MTSGRSMRGFHRAVTGLTCQLVALTLPNTLSVHFDNPLIRSPFLLTSRMSAKLDALASIFSHIEYEIVQL